MKNVSSILWKKLHGLLGQPSIILLLPWDIARPRPMDLGAIQTNTCVCVHVPVWGMFLELAICKTWLKLRVGGRNNQI